MKGKLVRDYKPAGDAPVPDEQVVVYQTCEICNQSFPLSEFCKAGRPRKDGKPTKVDSMCKYCRRIHDREVKKFVRQNSKKIDQMQLDLMMALAEEPMTDFEEIPNIGTAVQHLLRPFGGMQGLALQIASSYLSSPPGSPCRQKTHALLMKTTSEASKLGYAKKPMELLSDEELEAYLRESHKRLLKQIDDQEVSQEATEAEAGTA